MDVVVLQTGTANLASVVAALERLGQTVTVSRSREAIRDADRVVLPGVGTFAAGRGAIDAMDGATLLSERVRDGRATLGICLGMQLLAECSEESPGVQGLGAFSADARRFSPGARVPQMGWNSVQSNEGLITDGWAYFANSYALMQSDPAWSAAWSEHEGDRFIAAIEREGVLGCQFHPELSGDWGLELIERWLKETSC